MSVSKTIYRSFLIMLLDSRILGGLSQCNSLRSSPSQFHRTTLQFSLILQSFLFPLFITNTASFWISIMIRQIQKRPLGSVAIPLFLFHDASGTISSYYALGPMGRDVYAIADSRMASDTYESLQEKSRRHYAAIKSLVPEGRILVGGKRCMDANDHKMTDRRYRLVAGRHDRTSSRMDLCPRS